VYRERTSSGFHQSICQDRRFKQAIVYAAAIVFCTGLMSCGEYCCAELSFALAKSALIHFQNLLIFKGQIMVATPIQTQSSDIQPFSENGTSTSLEQRVGIIDPLNADRSRNTWHKVTFNVPFASNKKVVVIPMTQTYNGNGTPGLRIKNVTSSGFEIRFDEVVGTGDLSDGSHTTEQVGWVAYGFSNLPTPGKYYYLVVKHTQKVLNVTGGSKEDNIQLIQYDKSDSDNSKWLLEDAGNGSYYLVAKHSNKVANIAGGGSADGSNAVQYQKTNDDNSKWLLEDAGDGYFYIIGKQSGKVLQVNGGNKENNGKVDQWTKQNVDHHKWKFVAV